MNGSVLLVPIPLGAVFQQEAPSTKSHGIHPEPPAMLLQCVGTFRGATALQAKLCASVLRPENGFDLDLLTLSLPLFTHSPCLMRVAGAALPDLLTLAICCI